MTAILAPRRTTNGGPPKRTAVAG
jgi:hypothetical protein